MSQETDAMRTIEEVLEPLDRMTRRRILKWAEQRYLLNPIEMQTAGEIQALAEHFEQVGERARQQGVTVREYMHAISREREARGLGPMQVMPVPPEAP